MIKVTINYNQFIAIGTAQEPKLIDEFYFEDNDFDSVYELIKTCENNKGKINNIHFEYDVEMPTNENGEA